MLSAGIDVTVSNPCDVLRRTLDYSPFWLTEYTVDLAKGRVITVREKTIQILSADPSGHFMVEQ
jgi:hypothetical protein